MNQSIPYTYITIPSFPSLVLSGVLKGEIYFIESLSSPILKRKIRKRNLFLLQKLNYSKELGISQQMHLKSLLRLLVNIIILIGTWGEGSPRKKFLTECKLHFFEEGFNEIHSGGM